MSHLTIEQRYTIAVMYQNGKIKSDIATTIGKDMTVKIRLLLRNCKDDCELAEFKCQKRHLENPKRILLAKAAKEFIAYNPKIKYSLEQVAFNAKTEGVSCISARRIYKFIWQD